VRPPIDLWQPRVGDKRIQVSEGRERAGVEEVCNDVKKGFLDFPFRLWPPPSAGPRTKPIVEGEGEKPRVVHRLFAVPLLDDDLHVVVETHGRRATQVLKRPHMLADGRLKILRLDEAEIAPSRVSRGCS
jgi:hypothetical protein